MPIIAYKKQSILEAIEPHIAHGVNCQNVMGSGVAKVLYEKWPQIKIEYHKEMSLHNPKSTSDYLGLVSAVDIGCDRFVWNCWTQNLYGNDSGTLYVSYLAIRECFVLLNDLLKGETLAIPKIGSGLANGRWGYIEKIINEETPDIQITVYHL